MNSKDENGLVLDNAFARNSGTQCTMVEKSVYLLLNRRICVSLVKIKSVSMVPAKNDVICHLSFVRLVG